MGSPLGVAEGGAAVDEQPDAEGHVLDVDVVGGEGEDGGAGVGGPVAAGGVGDGDEGFPGVGGAVFDGQVGCGGFELVEVGADPAVQVGLEVGEGWTIAAGPVGQHDFVGCAAAHADDDGAVFDGVGHVADAGEGGHGEGGDGVEPAAAGVPAEGGAAALVAGVEQAAEVFVGVAGVGSEDGVGFVDQQGGRVGRVRADGPVDRRG